MTARTMPRVTELEAYLRYYCSLKKPPRFAVLITGDWGVGKTHQVMQAIPEAQRCYVSLNGLSTADDVHREILAALDPDWAALEKQAKKFGDVLSAGPGWFALGGSMPSVVLRAFRRNDILPEKILIFDDLERFDVANVDAALGSINTYLEHYGCKVVIVANTHKLEGFEEIKEKYVGQTIEAEPQVGQAAESFVSDLDDQGARDFIQKHQSDLTDVFHASGASSLRILRHLLLDIARLHSLIDPRFLKSKNAISELIRVFAALNVGIRSGKLSALDLRNRETQIVAGYMSKGKEGEKEVPLAVADKLHGSLNLASKILSDDLLVDMLVRGRFDATRLNNWLLQTPQFSEPETLPPWRALINFAELDDEETRAAKARVETQFETREVTSLGELLHIFSLRLLMAEHSEIDADISQVEDQCVRYLDDLLEADRVPLPEFDGRRSKFDRDSHGGYMYWVTDATRESFNKLQKHMDAVEQQAIEKKLPDLAHDLLETMKSSPDDFYEAVSYTNNGPNKYANVAILHFIEPKLFVDTWTGLKKPDWRTISYAFNGRYEHGFAPNGLEGEIPWLAQVIEEIDALAEQQQGLAAYRLSRVINLKLRTLVNEMISESSKDSPCP